MLIEFMPICKYCELPLSQNELNENRKVHEKCKKAHHIELKRKWRKENPEKVSAQDKRYKEKHGDDIRAYYETHKEQIRKKQREYNKKHYSPHPLPILSEEERAQRIRECKKKLYHKDIEKSRSISRVNHRKYYARHPDREKNRRRTFHAIEFFGGKEFIEHIPVELIELKKLHLDVIHEVKNL